MSEYSTQKNQVSPEDLANVYEMSEYSTQKNQVSPEDLANVYGMVLIDVARLDDGTAPGNTRTTRKTYELYEATTIGHATKKGNEYNEAWIERKIQEADSRDVFADIDLQSLDTVLQKSEHWATPSSTIGEVRELLSDVNEEDVALSASELLTRLSGADTPSQERRQLVCEAELIIFPEEERRALLTELWQYIQDFRDSNDCDELAAVGAAIRKYIAIIPMDEMGELAELLEPGHRAPLPVQLELEVAKMVYRNFEVHPPKQPDPHPNLGECLWAMAQDYVNPRFLSRDKYSSAVASQAIEALIAMQSAHSEDAWRAALTCPYDWFREVVSDDLDELRRQWASERNDAVIWFDALRASIGTDI
ncbi:MAG: hypothetical protein IID08_08225 [Candidatus Hydrogenedentes bacterium]|nr:hypothetical protein [Candidatus Hydrogenedentota bacterium]